MSGGFLFTLPMDSALVPAVASLAAVVLMAFVLRTWLRVPRVRSVAALAPVGALVFALALTWRQLELPTLIRTGVNGDLTILSGGHLVGASSLGVPLFLGLWAMIASLRVGRRVTRLRRMHRVALLASPPRDPHVTATVRAVATRLRVPAPRLGIIDGCPGGALLVGLRRPTIVVDAALLAGFDDEELEGLIAHELAHVRRRDNLLCLLVGVVRDVFFFVPGGRWVSKRLCAEREVAADQLAVRATERPGALASGLLKVLSTTRPIAACAAFAAPGALVTRVERLVTDERPLSGARASAEALLVAGLMTAAVGLAAQVPAAVSLALEDDMLAFGDPTHGSSAAGSTVPEAAVFAAFHASLPPREATAIDTRAQQREAGAEFAPAVLRAYLARPTDDDVIGWRPRAAVRVVSSLRATPVVGGSSGLGIYRVQRFEPER